MLIWCSLLLMLIIIDTPPIESEGMTKLSKRCEFVKEKNELLHIQCKGKFPMMTYLKFRDTFMKHDDHMAIFLSESKEFVMVSLKESELHYCESIQVVEVNQYVCHYGDTNGKRTIKFNNVMMYCFPFHIQMTDDLIHDCMEQRDKVLISKEETKVVRTTSGIIQYVFDNDSAGRLKGGILILTLLAVSLRWI